MDTAPAASALSTLTQKESVIKPPLVFIDLPILREILFYLTTNELFLGTAILFFYFTLPCLLKTKKKEIEDNEELEDLQ